MTRSMLSLVVLSLSATFASAAFAEEPAAAAPAAPAATAAAPAPEAAPVPAPTAAPAPVAPTTGGLSVSSTPAGKVFLDGTDIGLSTPVVDLPVAPGKHTLKVVDAASGREASAEFTIEAGGAVNLNLNLPEAAKPASTEAATAPAPEAAAEAKPAEVPWTWMTVSGWGGLGLGTIGLLAGAVVLSTPDPDQETLGFGLFGGGVGLVLGGAVLLYLDTELADAAAKSASPATSTEAPRG